MIKGYIYRHWRVLENGSEKSYVGQTIKKPEKRWKKGRGYTDYNSDTHFARAIKKYGWDGFNHEIIGVVEAPTREQLTLDLNEWEIYYIEKYNSYYSGYNDTLGGYAFSGESNPNSKKVICLNTKEVFNTCLEAKEWCGSCISGYLNCTRRNKHCGTHPTTGERLAWMFLEEYENASQEEIDKKLNRALQGRTGSASSSAQKVVCITTGDVFDTIKEGIKAYGLKNASGVCRSCKSGGYYGKDENGSFLFWKYYSDYEKLSDTEVKEELEQRIRKASKPRPCSTKGGNNPSAKKVICLNTKKVFSTMKEASEENSVSRGHIRECCTGKRKVAGEDPNTGEGLVWMYYTDYLNINA